MKPVIHQSFEKITATELDTAEKRIGKPIPLEYRNFLLVHNGGWPEPSDFTVAYRDGKSEQISVEWFLPVNTSESIDLEKTVAAFRERVPEDFFPFARIGGSSLIGIRTGKEHRGGIYFWNSEEEAEEGEAPTEENLYFVAESFKLFLDGLHE